MSEIELKIGCEGIERAAAINILLIRCAHITEDIGNMTLGHKIAVSHDEVVQNALIAYLRNMRSLKALLETKAG